MKQGAYYLDGELVFVTAHADGLNIRIDLDEGGHRQLINVLCVAEHETTLI